ncbi:hypothetical protein FQA39_LY13324 [Lamprigera yunnana]|nr:hypothetical protein FQA39_LY13324 [Lamprigera yunnana]
MRFGKGTLKQPRRKSTEADFKNSDCSEETPEENVEDNTDLELTVGTFVITRFPDEFKVVEFKCVSNDKDVFVKYDKDM